MSSSAIETSAGTPMLATKIDSKISRIGPYVLVAALSSLGTSWWFQTPVTERQAAKLQVVETQQLPALAKVIASKETQIKQLNCDKGKILGVAGQAIAADHAVGIPAPDYADLKGCPKVAPVKPPLIKPAALPPSQHDIITN